MGQWEHTYIDCVDESLRLIDTLKKYGEDGWELTAAVMVNSYWNDDFHGHRTGEIKTYRLFFKRLKQ